MEHISPTLHTMTKPIAFLVFFMLCARAFAEPPRALQPDTVFPPGSLVADAHVLEDAYTALHPGLYRYNTPTEIRRQFGILEASLRSTRTLKGAYLAFSRFAASVRCGHTYANFWNQTDAVQAALFGGATRLPFRFRWLDHQMVVTDPRGVQGLSAGTTILTINGVTTHAILEALMPYVSADGHNDAKRVDQLTLQGGDRYEAFDIFLPLVFPQMKNTAVLRVELPGARRPTIVHAAMVTDASRALDAPNPRESKPAWTLRYPDATHAVLDMPTWALYDNHWDWKAWLKASVDELNRRHVQTLVIDVRRNGGGLGVGDELIAHLIDSPLHFPGYRRLVRYRSLPAGLRPYLDTWDRSFDHWGSRAEPFNAQFFHLAAPRGESPDDEIQPLSPRYHGKVVVLVGPTNSSATFEFAVRIKAARLGTLVGQTTGGNLRGINGGAFYFLRLPHSHIELDVPLIGQFADNDVPDSGLAPDIAVAPTQKDSATGRDTVMEAALATERGH